MEEAPLNMAHREYRQAEKYFRNRRFEDAIQSHVRAAGYLREAMQATSNTRALESLQCQLEYHERQQEAVRARWREYDGLVRALEAHRLRDTAHADHLQLAIYKTMDQADSLLGLLSSGSNSLQSVDHPDGAVVPSNLAIGTKHPKNDETVIEELRTLNGQLHSLVSQLIGQLETSSQDVDLLRERVKTLEEEKEQWSRCSQCSTHNENTQTDGTSPSDHSDKS